MKVLVACEFSGIVRDAFLEIGADAVSCDLLPSERVEPHIIGDVLDVIKDHWDLMLAFPPCTYLASSGVWFSSKRREKQQMAIDFIQTLFLESNAPKICLENPVGILSTQFGKPDQIIQPWQFGHGETKATCLWLKGLPKLKPTSIVDGRHARILSFPPSKDRWKKRSRTYAGIAAAMAAQWGIC